jgi:hypothetical protein
MIPLWMRAAGKRGRLSAAEREAKEKNARRRADYQHLLDSYKRRGYELGLTHADLEAAREDAVYWRYHYTENLKAHAQTTAANRKHTAMGYLVLAGLAHMMSAHELTPTIETNWIGRTGSQFVNSYGLFELTFGDTSKIRVTPTDKTRRPIVFDLDEYGLTPMAVLGIMAHLGLPSDGQLPKRAARALRTERASSTDEATLIDQATADLLKVLATDCGNPLCPVHREELHPGI